VAGGRQPPQQWQQNLYQPHAPPQRYQPKRPAGIVVIAILMLIGAVLLLLAGFGLFVLAFLASGEPEFGGVLGALLGLVGLIMLLFGIAYIFLAMGLLKLKPWARKVARVLAAISIAFGILSVFGGDPVSIISLIFNIIIFLYLGSRGVKAAFEGSRLAMYQAPRVY
jgi:uncharacterized membrane protein (DUF2068 family)